MWGGIVGGIGCRDWDMLVNRVNMGLNRWGKVEGILSSKFWKLELKGWMIGWGVFNVWWVRCCSMGELLWYCCKMLVMLWEGGMIFVMWLEIWGVGGSGKIL